MKKVLFVIPDLRGGGAERVLVNLVNHLDKSRFSVTLLSIFDCGENKKRLSPDIAYRFIFKKQFRGNSHLFKALSPAQLYRQWIPETYDIVVSFLEGTAARLVSGCGDEHIRKLCWIHTSLRDSSVLAQGFRSAEEAKRCYAAFDQIVCVSEGVRQDFAQATGLDDMAVCYNPIDSESIRALAKQAPPVEVDANMLNLCAVGRLVPVKGFARLIPILRRLLDEGLLVHLYLCGEGAQRQKLEQAAQDAGVTPYVTLTGFLDNPYALMARCDLFVCSSFREGFSSAAAEALLCHLPVVTVDVPGMAELLNGSGVICENDDEALYLALRDVLLDENKRHLLRQSAAKRSKFFDIHSSVRAIEALLEAR